MKDTNELKKLADEGDDKAQYSLGIKYYNDLKLEKAYYYITKSAEKGNKDAIKEKKWLEENNATEDFDWDKLERKQPKTKIIKICTNQQK